MIVIYYCPGVIGKKYQEQKEHRTKGAQKKRTSNKEDGYKKNLKNLNYIN